MALAGCETGRALLEKKRPERRITKRDNRRCAPSPRLPDAYTCTPHRTNPPYRLLSRANRGWAQRSAQRSCLHHHIRECASQHSPGHSRLDKRPAWGSACHDSQRASPGPGSGALYHGNKLGEERISTRTADSANTVGCEGADNLPSCSQSPHDKMIGRTPTLVLCSRNAHNKNVLVRRPQ